MHAQVKTIYQSAKRHSVRISTQYERVEMMSFSQELQNCAISFVRFIFPTKKKLIIKSTFLPVLNFFLSFRTHSHTFFFEKTNWSQSVSHTSITKKNHIAVRNVEEKKMEILKEMRMKRYMNWIVRAIHAATNCCRISVRGASEFSIVAMSNECRHFINDVK